MPLHPVSPRVASLLANIWQCLGPGAPPPAEAYQPPAVIPAHYPAAPAPGPVAAGVPYQGYPAPTYPTQPPAQNQNQTTTVVVNQAQTQQQTTIIKYLMHICMYVYFLVCTSTGKILLIISSILLSPSSVPGTSAAGYSYAAFMAVEL